MDSVAPDDIRPSTSPADSTPPDGSPPSVGQPDVAPGDDSGDSSTSPSRARSSTASIGEDALSLPPTPLTQTSYFPLPAPQTQATDFQPRPTNPEEPTLLDPDRRPSDPSSSGSESIPEHRTACPEDFRQHYLWALRHEGPPSTDDPVAYNWERLYDLVAEIDEHELGQVTGKMDHGKCPRQTLRELVNLDLVFWPDGSTEGERQRRARAAVREAEEAVRRSTTWVSPLDQCAHGVTDPPQRPTTNPSFIGRFRNAWMRWMQEYSPDMEDETREERWEGMMFLLQRLETQQPGTVVEYLRLFERRAADFDEERTRQSVRQILFESRPPAFSPRASRANSAEDLPAAAGRAEPERSTSNERVERELNRALGGSLGRVASGEVSNLPSSESNDEDDVPEGDERTREDRARGRNAEHGGVGIEHLTNGVAHHSDDEDEEPEPLVNGVDADDDEQLPQVQTVGDEENYSLGSVQDSGDDNGNSDSDGLTIPFRGASRSIDFSSDGPLRPSVNAQHLASPLRSELSPELPRTSKNIARSLGNSPSKAADLEGGQPDEKPETVLQTIGRWLGTAISWFFCGACVFFQTYFS